MFYIVATPIGNKDDLTHRALNVLRGVDRIYCEDTRHSGVLMSAYDIHTPLYRLDKFCEREKTNEIILGLKKGDNIALISDAGVPLISDPGTLLISSLIDNGLDYTVISGTCACIDALVLSGIDTSRFYMCGFLPVKNKERDSIISEIIRLTCTLLFYVPPHDCIGILEYLHSKLGNRKVALVREISKLYEEVIRFTLDDIPCFIQKGEMVLVVEGNKKELISKNEQDIIALVKELIAIGYDKKEAIKEVSQNNNLKKSFVYNLLESSNINK